MGLVAIKNNSGSNFSDTFNGQSYQIPQAGIRKVPSEAAKLWFGIGGDGDDQYRALRRRGLLASPEWLTRFVPVQVREVFVEEEEGKEGAADPGKVTGGNTDPK